MAKKAKKKIATGKKSKAAKAPSISAAAKQDVVVLLEALVKKLTSFETKLDIVLGRITSQPVAMTKPQPAVIPAPEHGKRDRIMFRAVCADCGKSCEVPFKPKADRKVFCKECFSSRKTRSVFKSPQVIKPKIEITANTSISKAPKTVKKVKSAKKLPKKTVKKTPKKKKPAAKKKKAKK